jgi:hypothetical protein
MVVREVVKILPLVMEAAAVVPDLQILHHTILVQVKMD